MFGKISKNNFLLTFWLADDERCSVTGGLLFAVCRGKLSEGIDFSDNKARAVVVVSFMTKSCTDPEGALPAIFL